MLHRPPDDVSVKKHILLVVSGIIMVICLFTTFFLGYQKITLRSSLSWFETFIPLGFGFSSMMIAAVWHFGLEAFF
jgi:hypothetical protein